MRRVLNARGFRSGLEEVNAGHLRALGIDPRFESEKISYTKPARVCKYTPDFPLILPSGKRLYVETKGLFKADDRQKHLLIQAQHPEIDLRFVFTRASSRLSKVSKTTYAKWCDDHGFLWAEKLIPAAWLTE